MQHSPIRKPLGTAIMLVLAGGANGVAAGDVSSVAIDAAGNGIVAWQDNSGADGDLGGIFARRYNADGTPVTSAAFQVNTTAAGDQQSPVSAMTANGESIVVWQSIDEGGDSGIYAQRYAADGSALGAEFRVNSIASGAQQKPVVAMDAAGNFVVAWEDALAGGGAMGIMARSYLADGSALGDAFTISTNGTTPSVAMANGGIFTVTWTDVAGAVQMQRFDVNGVAVSGSSTVAAASAMRVAGLMTGKALIAGIDVGLTMTASASGNTVTYSITAINYGDTSSGALTVVDTLPSNTSYISGSGSGWSCSNNTPSNGKVTCNLASLGAGANSTVTIKVDATGASATSLTSSATAITSGDVNTANDTASKTVTTTGSSGGAAAAGAFSWFTLLLGFFGLRRRLR